MSENIQSISQGTYTIGQTSATNFVAGPGIRIDEPSAGTVRIGNDETVLWSGSTTVSTAQNAINLSETFHNFEYIKIIDNSLNPGGHRAVNTIPIIPSTISIATQDNWVDMGYNPTGAASQYQGWNYYSANPEGTKIITLASYISHMSNTGAPTQRNQGTIYSVIGINRISGSNA